METGFPTPESRYGVDAVAQFRARGQWRDDALMQWVDQWAERQPTHRAVSDGVRELSYAQLRDAAYRFARFLRSRGIAAGDRVAVQLPNWSEFLVCYLAAARIGAILVPIMPVYRENEVGHILRTSGARLAITTGEFRKFGYADMFRGLRESTSLRDLVIVRAAPNAGEFAFDHLPEVASEDLGPYPDADAGHVIIYSSGTESTAKGCYHTWNTIAFTARALAHDIFKMTPEDVLFMPSPVSHSTGIVIGLAVPLLVGAGIHLQDIWEPVEGLRRIEAYRCSITATATPFVQMALAAAKESTRDLSSMRAWLCAGAPIPPSLAHEFEKAFPKGKLLPLYGCTEVMAATVCRLDDSIERVASSDGAIAADGVKLKLLDGDGAEVATGEVGEICYWGPGAILAYWNDPERTAAAIDAEGWHHCGDLGRMDADGYLRITGRVKDIIIRGGQNLSAREIEEHLISHPQIADAAVVGYPDDRLGEKVCAFVIPRENAALTLPEITAYLRDKRQIAAQKLPERLALVTEFPMTATGKVQKFVLRERAKTAT